LLSVIVLTSICIYIVILREYTPFFPCVSFTCGEGRTWETTEKKGLQDFTVREAEFLLNTNKVETTKERKKV
jgi:hypothetical protein